MIKKFDGTALPDYQYINHSLLSNWFSGPKLLEDVVRITEWIALESMIMFFFMTDQLSNCNFYNG